MGMALASVGGGCSIDIAAVAVAYWRDARDGRNGGRFVRMEAISFEGGCIRGGITVVGMSGLWGLLGMSIEFFQVEEPTYLYTYGSNDG
jgi:hypothetical protein